MLRVLHGAGLVVKWRAIGQTLTVSDADLAGFDARFSGDPSLCLLQMVASWLRGQKRHPDPPSWCRLIWAVADPLGGGKHHEGLKIAASFKGVCGCEGWGGGGGGEEKSPAWNVIFIAVYMTLADQTWHILAS